MSIVKDKYSKPVINRFVHCVEQLVKILDEDHVLSSSMLVFRDEGNTYQMQLHFEKYDDQMGYDNELDIDYGEVVIKHKGDKK